jgi:hypothetical protein
LPRFYLKAIVAVTLVLGSLSIAARALGTTQPPNPALAGFTEGCEGKPQPCWYGIVPGVTTVETAKRMLQGGKFLQSATGILPFGGGGYFFDYQYDTELDCTASLRHYYGSKANRILETDTVDEIMMYKCPNLILGSLIDLTGQPEGIQMGSTRMGNQPMLAMNQFSTLVGVSDFSSPSVLINTVYIFSSGSLAYTQTSANWHGFHTNTEYCQMTDVPFPPCYCQACLP